MLAAQAGILAGMPLPFGAVTATCRLPLFVNNATAINALAKVTREVLSDAAPGVAFCEASQYATTLRMFLIRQGGGKPTITGIFTLAG